MNFDNGVGFLNHVAGNTNHGRQTVLITPQVWAADRPFCMFMCNTSLCVRLGNQSRFHCRSSGAYVHVLRKQTDRKKKRERERERKKKRERTQFQIFIAGLFIMYVQCYVCVM